MHDELRIFVPAHGHGQDESCESLRYPAISAGGLDRSQQHNTLLLPETGRAYNPHPHAGA